MAIEAKMSTQLRLVLYVGDDLMSGKPILKAKNFNQTKTNATPDQLFATANALSGLQEHQLYAIERRDNSEIKES